MDVTQIMNGEREVVREEIPRQEVGARTGELQVAAVKRQHVLQSDNLSRTCPTQGHKDFC